MVGVLRKSAGRPKSGAVTLLHFLPSCSTVLVLVEHSTKRFNEVLYKVLERSKTGVARRRRKSEKEK